MADRNRTMPMAAIGDAAFDQPPVEDARATPQAEAPYRAVAQG